MQETRDNMATNHRKYWIKKRASSRGRMRNQMEQHWKTWKKNEEIKKEGNLK